MRGGGGGPRLITEFQEDTRDPVVSHKDCNTSLEAWEGFVSWTTGPRFSRRVSRILIYFLANEEERIAKEIGLVLLND